MRYRLKALRKGHQSDPSGKRVSFQKCPKGYLNRALTLSFILGQKRGLAQVQGLRMKTARTVLAFFNLELLFNLYVSRAKDGDPVEHM